MHTSNFIRTAQGKRNAHHPPRHNACNLTSGLPFTRKSTTCSHRRLLNQGRAATMETMAVDDSPSTSGQQGSLQPFQLLQGPQYWYAKDAQASTEWVYR